MAEHCRESRLKACVGFQPMLYWLFLTLSGISPANRSRSGPKSCTCTGQGPTTFTKFWVRSAQLGQNWGSDDSHTATCFCPQNQTTVRQLLTCRFSPNLAMTRESMSPWNVSEQTPYSVSDQPRGRTAGRYCSPEDHGIFSRPGHLFVRRTVSQLKGYIAQCCQLFRVSK